MPRRLKGFFNKPSREEADAFCEAAAHADNEALLNFLERFPRSIDCRGVANRTALIRAVKAGHEETALLLLARGADPDEKDALGFAALLYAATAGDIKMAALLLKRRANVDAAQPNGWTALVLAARLGHRDMMLLLLKRGASLDKKDREGQTVRELIEGQGDPKTLAVIREWDKKERTSFSRGIRHAILAGKPLKRKHYEK